MAGTQWAQKFTLYSEEQAEVIKQLLANPRYSKEEVCHIVDEWNTFLEQIVMQEPSYDDIEISDYEHFRRRSKEMVEVFRSKAEFSDAEGNPLGEERLAQILNNERQEASQWEFICDFVHEHSEEELPLNSIRDGGSFFFTSVLLMSLYAFKQPINL